MTTAVSTRTPRTDQRESTANPGTTDSAIHSTATCASRPRTSAAGAPRPASEPQRGAEHEVADRDDDGGEQDRAGVVGADAVDHRDGDGQARARW